MRLDGEAHMKNNLGVPLTTLALTSFLLTGCGSAEAALKNSNCTDPLIHLGANALVNPEQLITDPTQHILPHELNRAALLTGMNDEDKERVNAYLTNENPFTEGEGLLLTVNQGHRDDLERDSGMILGSATIVRLPDGRFGVLTSAHVVYDMYKNENGFKLNKPLFMLVPTIGIVPLCDQLVEPSGYGADQPTIITLTQEIQELLIASEQSSGISLYPDFDPLLEPSLSEGETLIRYNPERNALEAWSISYVDKEMGQVYLTHVYEGQLAALREITLPRYPDVALTSDGYVKLGHSGQSYWKIGPDGLPVLVGTIYGYASDPEKPMINISKHR